MEYKMQLARQSVKMFPRTPYTDRKSVNTLRRGWMRQIEYLGEKWIMHPSNQVKSKKADKIKSLVKNHE